MSILSALNILYCDTGYEPSEAELEAQRIYQEQQEKLRQIRAEEEKHTLFNKRQFSQFARIEGESGAIGVKLLRDKSGELHWMDTNVWPFHYPFCVSTLGEKRTLQEFNEQVYTGKDRSMMFATVVAYPASNKQRYFCLELNPADPMNDLNIIDGFFSDVKQKFMTESTGVALYFHPTSAAQLEAIKDQKLCLPVITSETLFGGIQYRMIYPGRIDNKTIRVFNQKIYKDEDLHNWLLKRTPTDIVVIPSVPNDIPVVGGVICAEIIPPLCHVALLCQNRQTPCCYVKDCIELMSKELPNQVVTGSIQRNGYFVNGDYKEIKVQPVDPPKIEIQKPNTSVTNLIDIHEDKEHAKDIHIVGAKAAQFAKIESIYSQPIFKGTFVIPFHHYNKHVYLASDISEAINAKCAHMNRKDFNFNEFKSVQEVISNSTVDNELLTSVIDKIKQHNMTSVIFRSSTNAEDLTGFNGAGLYESVPLHGNDVHDHQKVGEAIKKVWASVWKPIAVKERHHYGMSHQNVNMAVLVQPYIDNKMTGVKVHYNGVCITHDVARHKFKHGFVVNCFPGITLRATGFNKNQFPEHTTIMLGREENSIDLLVSNLATGLTQSLITREDAEKMVKVFGEIHTTTLGQPHKLDDTTALDIEFMVVDNEKTGNKRELVVLQARPYTVNVLHNEADLEHIKQTHLVYRYWHNDLHFCFWTGDFE